MARKGQKVVAVTAASNGGIVRETCSKPGCAAVPTIREDMNGSRRLGVKPERTYLLCERHNEEYFGRSGWLEAKVAERIRGELVVKRV